MHTIIIADSGSTKTNWHVCSGEESYTVRTAGINPFMQEPKDIYKMLMKELLPYLSQTIVEAVYFYGAGCTPEKCPEMCALLQDLFPQTTVEVASDMLGAARALCGHRAGVACILGTGSNSCLYNGKEIVGQVSPLGFILGDEGSGAVLGKRLVGDLLKGQMEPGLKEAFLEEYKLTPADIIRKVYREEYPNRFLASFTPFLQAHRQQSSVRELLLSCFTDFFRRNVLTYKKPELPVHIIGGLTVSFDEEIQEAARRCGVQIGNRITDPMEGLVRYHTAQL
jgi:N-acetylglucosamine kinase-like BadF-type ATPase